MSADIPLLYRDPDLVVVAKPAGMLTESLAGTELSLVDLLGQQLGRRAVAYHRLDRETSGCVLLGLSPRWHAAIQQAFAEKRVRKAYWALTAGAWPRHLNAVDAPLGPAVDASPGTQMLDSTNGKPARTTFRVLGGNADYSWIEALPKTGRTHQIRVHCAISGHPILGDIRYGGPVGEFLALHAHSLRLRHPGGQAEIRVMASVPPAWEALLRPFR